MFIFPVNLKYVVWLWEATLHLTDRLGGQQLPIRGRGRLEQDLKGTLPIFTNTFRTMVYWVEGFVQVTINFTWETRQSFHQLWKQKMDQSKAGLLTSSYLWLVLVIYRDEQDFWRGQETKVIMYSNLIVCNRFLKRKIETIIFKEKGEPRSCQFIHTLQNLCVYVSVEKPDRILRI